MVLVDMWRLSRRIVPMGLVFVLTILVSVSGASDAGVSSPSLPIRLSYSDMFPADHPLGQLTIDWARQVAARTDGLVEVVVHSGGSLTSPQECFDGVLDGLSDMCHTALAYTPHRFPIMEAADFPGYPAAGTTARLTTRVAHEIFDAYGRNEFEGVHVLYVHAHPPGVFTSNDESVARVDDFRGLRVRSTGLSAAITAILGGTPVAWPATQTYELLKNDVVDATMGPLESLKYNRFAEVTRYTAVAPELGYVTTFAVVMRDDVWATLPADVQSVIDELNDEYQAKAAAVWDDAGREAYEYALARGHRFTTLAADEVAMWSETVLRQLEADYIERLGAIGVDGQRVLTLRDAVIASFLNELAGPGQFTAAPDARSRVGSDPDDLWMEIGETRLAIPFAQLQRELPTVTTTVQNPFSEELLTIYEGFWLDDVLRFMPIEQGNRLEFITKDSYEASIALADLAETPLRAFLAFREVGADGDWGPLFQQDAPIDPAPYWLMWAPVEPSLGGDTVSVPVETLMDLPWPWQTVGIRLVDSR